jgi:hypothetical protein
MQGLRLVKCFLLFFFGILLSHQVSGFQKPSEDKTPFQWLDASGETSGLKYATHRLKPISLQTESGPPVEIVTEKTEVDSQTTRIVRRAYGTSPNGARTLNETIVEEIKRLPGDRIRAVRTVSRPDTNGRVETVRRETQEMTPVGTDVYRITKTVSLPGTTGALEAKEQVTQIEKRKGEDSIEIDRTRYQAGMNGGWAQAERRISRNTVGKEKTQTDEDVYSPDLNNQLSLSRQLTISESKDSSGRVRSQSDSYASDIDGKVQLTERLTIDQTPLRDGRQETTQVLEKPNPIAAREGLQVVRKVVEDLQVKGENETERHLQVLQPDLNGKMRTVESWQTMELK